MGLREERSRIDRRLFALDDQCQWTWLCNDVVSFLDLCSYSIFAQYDLLTSLHTVRISYVLPGPPRRANLRTMLGPISSYSALVWQ
jgi:hypothetical protein